MEMNKVNLPTEVLLQEALLKKNNGPIPPLGAVGLLGGSFNPPHYGHLAISRFFQRECQLDRVVWLITPHNPLKDPSIYLPLSERLKLVHELIKDEPGILVWDIEKKLKTCESIQTVKAIQQAFPSTKFIWLMGADLLIELPLWPTWCEFLNTIPIAVYPRPDFTEKAKQSLVTKHYAHAFLKSEEASQLICQKPPALIFMEAEEYPISSTMIRKQGEKVVREE